MATKTIRCRAFDAAVEEAKDAFWEKFASCFPQFTTGDAGFDATMEFNAAARAATSAWIKSNGGRIEER